jgi:glycosyltransferase involved in cell wall biosynthesis
MPRLFIIDPSLKDIRGHHYMLTQAATLSAQAHGFDVTWLCSKEFNNTLQVGGANVRPTFSSSMYDPYIRARRGTLSSLPHAVNNILRRKNQPPNEHKDTSFESDLKEAMQSLGAGPDDRLLLHTGDGQCLPAILRILQTMEAAEAPSFHVATPYDPAGVMPHRTNMAAFSSELSRLEMRGFLNRKLFLYAENSPLAAHLSELWSVQVGTLPVPAFRQVHGAAAAAASTYRRDVLQIPSDNLIIASLGSARTEKGFHHIPEIIRSVRKMIGESRDPVRKATFVLQASPQIVGRNKTIRRAIGELKAMRSSNVKLLLESLSETEYEALLHASEVILTPYGEDEYRFRSSGIVTEAIAAGKVLVASANTYPGAMAKQYGGAAGDGPDEIAAAIVDVCRNWKEYKERARERSAKFRDENTVRGYWRICLDAEAQSARMSHA